MKQRFLLLVSVAFLQVVLLTACSKGGTDTPAPNPPGPPNPPDPGTIAISIPEATENPVSFLPFSDVKTVDVFSVNRAGSNTLSNNTAVSVEVERKPELIEELNLTKGTAFEVLPDSVYTTSITPAGNIYTLNFAAGDLSKKFSISVNGAKWNLAHDYAMAFVVKTATGGTISSFKDTVITVFSVKNKWDGVYSVTGTYSDAVVAGYTAYYPYEWELRTTGVSQCVVIDKKMLGGDPGFAYNTGAVTTFYADFGLIVNFDPVTDKVVSVVNYYGQPATNTRSAVLDPSGVNAYNNSSKTIDIKYWMKQPSAVATAPNIRAYFNEKWIFSKAR